MLSGNTSSKRRWPHAGRPGGGNPPPLDAPPREDVAEDAPASVATACRRARPAARASPPPPPPPPTHTPALARRSRPTRALREHRIVTQQLTRRDGAAARTGRVGDLDPRLVRPIPEEAIKTTVG